MSTGLCDFVHLPATEFRVPTQARRQPMRRDLGIGCLPSLKFIAEKFKGYVSNHRGN
jgi:hypothetical protein